MRRRTLAFPCLALALAASAAAQSTWSGAVDSNFFNAGNWDVAPTTNSVLSFPSGITNRNLTIGSTNFTAGTISFAGTGAYTLSGTGILSVGSSISSTATSGASVTIGAPVALTVPATFSTTGGDLNVAAVDNNGNNLTLAPGNTGGTRFVVVSGAITNSGGLIASGTGVSILTSTSNTWSGGTTINSGSALQIGSFAGNVGSLPGNVVDNGTLQIKASNTSFNYGGNISGTGNFLTLGTNTITLSGSSNTYGGNTTVGETSTLEIGATNALPTTTALNVNTGATLKVSNSQQIDRFNGGSGTINLQTGMTLTVAAAGTTQTSFGGKITGSGSLVINGINGSKVDLTSTTSDFTGGTTVTSGQLNLDTNAVLGTGPVTIGSAGMIVGKNATMSGTLNLSGKIVALPSLSVGATTVNPGAAMTIALADAASTAGTGWSLLNISGGLTLAATSGNKFALSVVSFAGSTQGGQAANFDTTQNYSFTIASSTGVTGFDSSAISLNMSGFANAYTGTWAVQNVGNNLVLAYTGGAPIPEPGAAALLAGLAASAVVGLRRRSTRRN